MSHPPSAALEENDFEAIEDAVMETARGRWFLREYGRRMRAADGGRLMEALTRIEGMLARREPALETAAQDFEDHARALEERHGRLAEIGWMLRERGYDGDICAMIEQEARAVGRLARTLRGGGRPGAPDEPRPGSMEELLAIQAPLAVRAPLIAQAPLAIQAPAETVVKPRPLAPVAPPEPDLPPPPQQANIEPDWREKAITAFQPVERMSTREKLALFA